MFPSHPTRLIVFVWAMLFVGRVVQADNQSHPLPDDSNKSIRELQQKRRAVLAQLVKVQTKAYQHGEASISAVLQSQRQLLQVDLELAETQKQRIAILERAVKLISELEKIANAQYKAGRASQADLLRCQAETLEVRIVLSRARKGVKPPNGQP